LCRSSEEFRPSAKAMLEDVQRTAVDMAATAGYVHLGDFSDGEHLGGDFLAAAAKLTARLENNNDGGGFKVSTRPTHAGAGDAAASSSAATHGRKLTQASATDVFLELIIVNDKARVDQYGSDTSLLHSDAIHVTNIVSTLFRNKFTPNLNIVLVSQMDNAAADPWTVAVDAKVGLYKL
jgi:hypothetical protein